MAIATRSIEIQLYIKNIQAEFIQNINNILYR